MFLNHKPIIYLWRPVYKAVFQRLVWPFLARVKAFFFLESLEELRHIRRAMESLLGFASSTEAEIRVVTVRQQNEQMSSGERHTATIDTLAAIARQHDELLSNSDRHAATLETLVTTARQQNARMSIGEQHTAELETLIATVCQQNNTLIEQNHMIFARLAALEAEHSSQWNNISKLLLCIYQQPKSAVSAVSEAGPQDHPLNLSRSSASNSSAF